MPKKTLRIDKYHGGLANYKNERDLAENELVKVQDVMVNIEGKIVQMGESHVYTPANGNNSPLSNILAAIEPGSGLFSFGSDYDLNGYNLEGNFGLQVVAVQNKYSITFLDGAQFYYEYLHQQNEMGYPVPIYSFAYQNGILRVCDSNFSNTDTISAATGGSHSKVFYPIFRTLFGNTSAPIILSDVEDADSDNPTHKAKWMVENQKINGSFNELSNKPISANIDTDPTDSVDSHVIGLHVSHDASSIDGEWNDSVLGDLKFGYSLLYDDDFGFGKQESPIAEYSNTYTSLAVGNQKMKFKVSVHQNLYNTEPTQLYNGGYVSWRVTGARIYWIGEGTNTFEDPFILGTIDFSRGIDNEAVFIGHNNAEQLLTVTGSLYKTASFLEMDTQPVVTFELENFYKHDVEYNHARYKTSVIANNVHYIGNINQGGRVYPDRMIKSPVGKFDIFPSSNFLDVSVGDGDAIVALESYADRLLQFKKESLYIINISGDYEYIESHHMHKGCSHTAAVTKISEGIAWVNKNGCYIYNGESVEDITFGKLNPEHWAEFIKDYGIIGYLAKEKQLIVTNNPTGSSLSGAVYIYDLTTKSWTTGIDKLPNTTKSNIITTYNGDTLFASNLLGSETASTSFQQEDTGSVPTDGAWQIANLGSATVNNTKLRIQANTSGGTVTEVTDFFSYVVSSEVSWQDTIINAIAAGGYGQFLQASAMVGGDVYITQPGHLSDDIPNDVELKGPMTWSTQPTVPSTLDYVQPVINYTYWSTSGMRTAFLMNAPDIPNTPQQAHQSYIFPFNDSSETLAEVWRMALPADALLGEQFELDADEAINDADQKHHINTVTVSNISGTHSTMGFGWGITQINMTDSSILGNRYVKMNGLAYSTPYGYGDSMEGWSTSLGFYIGHESYSGTPVNNFSGEPPRLSQYVLTNDSQSIRFTGFSCFIGRSSTDYNWTICLPYKSAYEAYNISDLITFTYSNSRDDTRYGTNLFHNKQFAVIEKQYIDPIDLVDTSDQPQTQISIENNMNRDNGWTIFKCGNVSADLNDQATAEYIHATVTIANNTVGTTVPHPTQFQPPSPGSGEVHGLKISRMGVTGAGSNYEISLSSATGESKTLTVTTTAGQTTDSLIDSIKDRIDSEWVNPANGNKLISSVDKCTFTGNVTFAVDGSTKTLTAAGMYEAGIRENMELKLSGSGSNDAKTVWVTGITNAANDVLTVSPTAGEPFTGIDTVVAQGTTSFTLTASSLNVTNIPFHPEHVPMIIDVFNYSNQLMVHKFDNSFQGSGSNNVDIQTKEFDFGNLSSKKTILGMYISHNLPKTHIAVQIKTDINSIWQTVNPDEDITGMATYKYTFKLKDIKTFQVRFKSLHVVTGYEINDLSIIYRDKGIR